ncbi:hypothetical protein R2F61_03915 [Mollicutes bacterium LVI A0078]|nr:hypothetical protein RZE84_03940 [Mollicutes bacterium LVI A0075]WOO91709.1 hypothetical protein R2F61_03915 [Mollicutes bacterium LVI A0078]
MKIEYTDGTVDTLKDQALVVKDKDVLKTINYSGIKAAAKAYTFNYLFWIGVGLTLLIGVGVFFLMIGLLVTDKSKPYQTEGGSMMKLF